MTKLDIASFLSALVAIGLTLTSVTIDMHTRNRTRRLLRDARAILDEAKRLHEEAMRLAAEPKRDEADWWKD